MRFQRAELHEETVYGTHMIPSLFICPRTLLNDYNHSATAIFLEVSNSRTQFINLSSLAPNVEPRILSIGGEIRVAFFAARPLAVGEELFFNYG